MGEEPMQVDGPESLKVLKPQNWDLREYSNLYRGTTLFQRLKFVEEHCAELSTETLVIAEEKFREKKPGSRKFLDVKTYKDVFKRLNEKLEGSGKKKIEMDKDRKNWFDETRKLSQQNFDRLEQDLKKYKNNNVKESIRKGYMDLGAHYADCNDLGNALKCFTHTRDYCTSSSHIIDMSCSVTKVSMQLMRWDHVSTYTQKALVVPEMSEFIRSVEQNKQSSQQRDENQKNQFSHNLAHLYAAEGVYSMVKGNYKTAATKFIKIASSQLNFTRDTDLGPDIQVLCEKDVAIYGGLCALATFTRDEVHSQLIASGPFKKFLEHTPDLREVISLFHESKYSRCLQKLDIMKSQLKLDIYLWDHVDALYTKIRKQAMIQYFGPYVRADMRAMQASMNLNTENGMRELESELIQLILDDSINAQIDSKEKHLHARRIEHRNDVFQEALSTGADFKARIKELMLRTVVLKNKIIVEAEVGR